MPEYIAYINRPKNHAIEDTLMDYYRATTLGIIEAPYKLNALSQALSLYGDRPGLNVMHVRSMPEAQVELAREMMLSPEERQAIDEARKKPLLKKLDRLLSTSCLKSLPSHSLQRILNVIEEEEQKYQASLRR